MKWQCARLDYVCIVQWSRTLKNIGGEGQVKKRVLCSFVHCYTDIRAINIFIRIYNSMVSCGIRD